MFIFMNLSTKVQLFLGLLGGGGGGGSMLNWCFGGCVNEEVYLDA